MQHSVEVSDMGFPYYRDPRFVFSEELRPSGSPGFRVRSGCAPPRLPASGF
jgi:hypothetical protein